MRYIELSKVKQTATREGEKDYITLQETDDGIFTVKRGEIGIQVGKNKQRIVTMPYGSWDITVTQYLSRGYRIVPGRNRPAEKKLLKKDNKSENQYAPEKDPAAQELVDMLLSLARKVVEECFAANVLVDIPSSEQFAEGETLLKKLEAEYRSLSVQEFNHLLCQYFMVMPRRMKYLSDNLAKGKDRHGRKLPETEASLEKARIISAEMDRYDILKSLVSNENPDGCTILKTATQRNGIVVRNITKEESEWIKQKLKENSSKFVRAWKIENLKTEQDFKSFCTRENLSEDSGISHLFHGSRGENFWSIITNGLTINPLNVVITGKAYGQGTYFAPDARKSLGYTDRSGSKWAHGGRETGLLGIYKVATGKRYDGSLGCDSSLTWNKLQKICPGAHCTWAESRYSGFVMDEVIVYQDCQSTIEYLVEVSA